MKDMSQRGPNASLLCLSAAISLARSTTRLTTRYCVLVHPRSHAPDVSTTFRSVNSLSISDPARRRPPTTDPSPGIRHATHERMTHAAHS